MLCVDVTAQMTAVNIPILYLQATQDKLVASVSLCVGSSMQCADPNSGRGGVALPVANSPDGGCTSGAEIFEKVSSLGALSSIFTLFVPRLQGSVTIGSWDRAFDS